MKKYSILLLAAALFASCNDWLDVTPKDKQLEKDQFSSEANINSATMGLYREFIYPELYGGNLTQTTIEVMGHFYSYGASESSDTDILPFYHLGNFQYDRGDNVKGRFSNIWSKAYATLLHINVYIKNLKESSATISEKNKSILLGEAYGLRAYLHFDLFRIFGPAWQDRNDVKILPYHNKASVTLNHIGYEEAEYSTADAYMALLWEDIETAKAYLETNDPVVYDNESITKDLLSDHFYQNRNRRMNYYAVKGLEARVLQYCGRDADAAAAAKVITDQVGSDKRFKWVNLNKMESQSNYIFFFEVIFGINKLNMISDATTWYMKTQFRGSYLVDKDNLFDNILGYEGVLEGMPDVRARQWRTSNITYNTSGYSPVTYVSKKYLDNAYEGDDGIPAIKNLQVLMRTSEMYYIQAEAALKAGQKELAVILLNLVLQYRGLTEAHLLSSTATDIEVQAHIEKEYYREFFGEGQVFFYHKRRGSTKMFNGGGTGTATISDPASAFVVPIPNNEKDV